MNEQRPIGEPDGRQQTAGWLIVMGQAVGLGLVCVGGYYLLVLLLRVVQAVNTPDALLDSLAGVEAVIGAEAMVIPDGGTGIKVGRGIAMVALVVWYLVWLVVAGRVLTVGTTLLTVGRDDRKLLETTVRTVVETALEKQGKK